MNSYDLHIQTELENANRKYSLPWLQPIVTVQSNIPNPFLETDIPLVTNHELLQKPVGRLFCMSGCQMDVEFPDENGSSKEDNQQSTSNLDKSQPGEIKQSSSSCELNRAFSYCSSSEFISFLPAQGGNIFLLPIKISKFEMSIKPIEPIIATIFLFTTDRNAILTDTFYPTIYPNVIHAAFYSICVSSANRGIT